jgi:hypothetical protein
MLIQSQTFAFAPPQQGVTENVQSNPISNVPIDGSASVTVPFPQPFAQYVKSITVQYTPASDTGYQISTAVLPISPAPNVAESLSGFVLVARGGPIGDTDSFTYTAEGL